MQSRHADAAHRGRHAEEAVANHLVRAGYIILGRNVRVGHLELDIVARLGSVVAIVEVRHRGPTSWQGPFESIGPRKQERLRRAAQGLWRQRFAQDASVERVRFDVAAVSFKPDGAEVDYIEGAI